MPPIGGVHVWGFWVWRKCVSLKAVFILDFAQLLSSRVWELCSALDASWYCWDCQRVLIWGCAMASYCGFNPHAPLTNEGWASSCVYWLYLCLFPSLFKFSSHFSSYLSSHQNCKMCSGWPAQLLTHELRPLLPLCLEQLPRMLCVVKTESSSPPHELFRMDITSICITFFIIPCAPWL